ncbi:MAG: hypothetical protein ACJ760_16195 [Thermoleophilaceae bacterium]
MPYGNDVTVYVEDVAGDLGGPSVGPWWLSPDVDIPAHSGLALQGPNDVQIRVHTHEEPILDEKIVAEVYVCTPSLGMSPSVSSARIDPGNLLFRPPGVTGTEPVAGSAGGTLTFSWTPSSSASQPNGPGHRCLVVRAFPQSVTPPTTPFDIPTEQHEAQHNLEILATTMKIGSMNRGGAGVPGNERRRDKETGLWWERLLTVGPGARGKRFVAWAFDPEPGEYIDRAVRRTLREAKIRFSPDPPAKVELEVIGARATRTMRPPVRNPLFLGDRLLAGASFVLGPRKPAEVLLRFDHSNLKTGTAAVMHVAQVDARGIPEGGMTVIAVAPTDA